MIYYSIILPKLLLIEEEVNKKLQQSKKDTKDEKEDASNILERPRLPASINGHQCLSECLPTNYRQYRQYKCACATPLSTTHYITSEWDWCQDKDCANVD